MKIILFVVMVIFLSTGSAATDGKENQDPFDMSESSSKVSELGIVTKPQVDALENKAKELFNSGKCSEAIPVLSEYAKKANFLANIISSTLDPFYSASYDDRKSYPLYRIKVLSKYEKIANQYKRKRNIAIAMQGECLIKMGENKQAIPMLMKALKLIDIDSEIWWERTKKNLLDIVEVE